MLNRDGVISCIRSVYANSGNGEKVCPRALSNWVLEVCTTEFKREKGKSHSYVGEWYWGEDPQVTEVFAEVKMLDSAIADDIKHDFAAVAEFVKWGFIYQQLVEFNHQSRKHNDIAAMSS